LIKVILIVQSTYAAQAPPHGLALLSAQGRTCGVHGCVLQVKQVESVEPEGCLRNFCQSMACSTWKTFVYHFYPNRNTCANGFFSDSFAATLCFHTISLICQFTYFS